MSPLTPARIDSKIVATILAEVARPPASSTSAHRIAVKVVRSAGKEVGPDFSCQGWLWILRQSQQYKFSIPQGFWRALRKESVVAFVSFKKLSDDAGFCVRMPTLPWQFHFDSRAAMGNCAGHEIISFGMAPLGGGRD